MKWFKHLVGSTSDPDLMESETLFKSDGTYVFWRVLEILSREDVFQEPLVINFATFHLWFPAISKKKLIKVLDFFNKKKRILYHFEDENISIFCDKLLVISSDYAAKLQKKPKKVCKISTLEVRSKNKKEKKNKDKDIYRKFDHLKITNTEFAKLNETYTKQQIDDVISRIQNHRRNTNYKSLYLTANNWLKDDIKKQQPKRHGVIKKDGSMWGD